jgi:hypothetical protein
MKANAEGEIADHCKWRSHEDGLSANSSFAAYKAKLKSSLENSGQFASRRHILRPRSPSDSLIN